MATAGTYGRSTNTITVTSAGHGLVVGQLILFTATAGAATSGIYAVVTSVTTFTITDRASGTITAPVNCTFDTTGIMFSGTYDRSGNVVTVATPSAHGLVTGQTVQHTYLASGATAGIYSVTVTSPTTYTVIDPASGALSAQTVNVRVQPAIAVGFDLSATVNAVGAVRYFHVALPLPLSSNLVADGAVRQISVVMQPELAARLTCEGQIIQTGIRLGLDLLANLTCQGGASRPFALPLPMTAVLLCEGVVSEFSQPAEIPPIALNMGLVMCINVTRGRETFRDLLDDAAKLWGLSSAGCGTQTAERERLVADANAMLQLMFSRAAFLDYFNRATRTYTLPATVTVLALETDVQGLHGYVRAANDQPINPAATLAEVERYADCYLTPDDDLSVPHIYYLRSQQAATAYGIASTLIFSPAPVADVQLRVEVTLNAPRYTWADYENYTPINVVHRYVASILYPLMRKQTASARRFVAKEQQHEIDVQHLQAMRALGLADPAPFVTRDAKVKEPV